MPKSKPGTKKQKNKRFLMYLMVILSILLLSVIILIAKELGYIKNTADYQNKSILYSAPDECTVIAGKIIHTINDEDICRAKCLALCEVRELKLDIYNFTSVENDCHLCSCKCK